MTMTDRERLKNFERRVERIAIMAQSIKWAAELLVDDIRVQLVKMEQKRVEQIGPQYINGG